MLGWLAGPAGARLPPAACEVWAYSRRICRTMSGTWKRWQDWLTVVVGVLLFVAPFIFGAGAGTPAALTAYIGGVLLVIAGVWSLSSPSNQAAEWAAVVVGVLVFIAPWVIGFTSLTPIAWSAWIA
ncbi:MAG: hypothetical protein E6I75_03145, partial [Chloroflexi bacterium]